MFHLDPGILGPLDPKDLSNSFGDDPLLVTVTDFSMFTYFFHVLQHLRFGVTIFTLNVLTSTGKIG
jgi:hypothetical protein